MSLHRRSFLALCVGGVVSTGWAPAGAASVEPRRSSSRSLPAQVAYVASLGDDYVVELDLAANKVTKRIGGFRAPWAAELNQDGSLLYVAETPRPARDPASSVAVMRTADNKIIKRIPTLLHPMLSTSPDGKTLFAPNIFTAGIQEIDGATARVTKTYPSLLMPEWVLAPEPETLWVATANNVVYAMDRRTGIINGVVDLLGIQPWQMSLSPDRSQVVIADMGGQIAVADVAERKVVKRIDLGPLSQPGLTAWTPDGTHLWVTNYSVGTVTVLDMRTFKAVAHWTNHRWNTALALSPDGERAYVATTEKQIVPYAGVLNTFLYEMRLARPGGRVEVYDVKETQRTGKPALLDTIHGVGNGPNGFAIPH